MAIKDRRDTVPKIKDMADVKTEIAIARYATFRKPTTSKPDKPPQR